MARGTLIAESMQVGSTLAGVPVVVYEIERVAPTNISAAQRAARIPAQWTLLRFEVADSEAERLANALADVLAEFGWYTDFHTAEESFVVFAGRVFRYARDDAAARSEAESYARVHGVPEEQIDWP